MISSVRVRLVVMRDIDDIYEDYPELKSLEAYLKDEQEKKDPKKTKTQKILTPKNRTPKI